MLQKWRQSTLKYHYHQWLTPKKTSIKLVYNQQVALRSKKYQKGKWQTLPPLEREPELTLCHQHSWVTCTQQKGLPDPAVPQPLPVTVILEAIFCLWSVLLNQKKTEFISMKILHNEENYLGEHAENLSLCSFPVLILSPSTTIRSLLGTGCFVRRIFDAAHCRFSPLPTSCLMVFTWHNTDCCKSNFSFIQNHPCCKSMQSSPCF